MVTVFAWRYGWMVTVFAWRHGWMVTVYGWMVTVFACCVLDGPGAEGGDQSHVRRPSAPQEETDYIL